VSKINVSLALFAQGHIEEAEKLQREALTSEIRRQGPDHPNSLEMQTCLTATLNAEGRYTEAEKLARQTYEAELRIHGPQHTHTVNALQQLGIAMAHTQRYAEASTLFREAIAKQDKSAKQGDDYSIWYSFACVAASADRPDDTLQYLQEAINRGYKNAEGLMADPDLRDLHSNPKFQQLVAELKSPPVRAQIQ
jgi:tetratricopeptide (TPR) repeat protein